MKSVTHATPDLQLPDVPDGRLVSEGASVCGGGQISYTCLVSQ